MIFKESSQLIFPNAFRKISTTWWKVCIMSHAYRL